MGKLYLLTNLTFLILLITADLSLLGQPSNLWQLARDREGVEVYIHRAVERQVKGFKATTTVNISMEDLETILDNVDEYPNWHAGVKYAKKILKKTEETFYVLVKTNNAWPAKDQELTWFVNKHWDKSEGYLFYDQICSLNVSAEKRVNEQIPQAWGGWRLRELESGEVEIQYILSADQGGKLPTWLINILSADNPHKTLCNLKALVDEPKSNP